MELGCEYNIVESTYCNVSALDMAITSIRVEVEFYRDNNLEQSNNHLDLVLV